MTSRTHQIYNIIFEHGFDPPPSPVWTMLKKLHFSLMSASLRRYDFQAETDVVCYKTRWSLLSILGPELELPCLFNVPWSILPSRKRHTRRILPNTPNMVLGAHIWPNAKYGRVGYSRKDPTKHSSESKFQMRRPWINRTPSKKLWPTPILTNPCN